METIRADKISTFIRERIEQYNREVKVVNTGTVLQVGDGIARIHGLDEVMAGELIEFEEGTIGIALNLESNNVGVVLMGDGLMIQEGTYLGRVVNGLAKPIDGRGEISSSESRLIESPAPGIISRRFVYEPLQTRLIAIDLMIPVGHGQRELIIGDKQTGKTTVATNTVLNQKGKNVVARSYRQISLLLRRPPGREDYPGDMFSLHSRLLERAAKLSTLLGEGSMTTLPIVETQYGYVSAYIPTNVISITNGQIFLSADLFNAGIRPTLYVGISVFRVGSAAQIKAMKQVAGKLKLELAQFAEGQRLRILLKQAQSAPLTVEKQVMTIYTRTNGYLDSLKIDQVKKFIVQLRTYLKTNKPQLQEIISSTKKFPEEA
ncbi:hypothetical protein MKX03_012839 [Papaver bracteatum]|nr:hypothetical protein MKX03_012839 [Papaver bracteatum]